MARPKGCTISPEHRRKIAQALLGNKNKSGKKQPQSQVHRRKKVVQLTPNHQIVNIYESMVEAQRTTGIAQSQISKAANGINHSAGGFLWQFCRS